jgi:hypothetical protein
VFSGTVVDQPVLPDSPSFPQDSLLAAIDGQVCPLTVSTHGDVKVVEGRIRAAADLCCQHHAQLQWLREADRLSIRKLFHTLPAPQLKSLSGEYDAELLDQGGALSRMLTKRVFGMHGTWLGKAFHGLNELRGVGYNFFRAGERVIQKLPMDLRIQTSTMDDQPSLQLCYGAKNRGLIRGLCGEVRQVTPHILLGIGVFGPILGKRDILRRKIPFVLAGPCRPFQHQP